MKLRGLAVILALSAWRARCAMPSLLTLRQHGENARHAPNTADFS